MLDSIFGIQDLSTGVRFRSCLIELMKHIPGWHKICLSGEEILKSGPSNCLGITVEWIPNLLTLDRTREC